MFDPTSNDGSGENFSSFSVDVKVNDTWQESQHRFEDMKAAELYAQVQIVKDEVSEVRIAGTSDSPNAKVEMIELKTVSGESPIETLIASMEGLKTAMTETAKMVDMFSGLGKLLCKLREEKVSPFPEDKCNAVKDTGAEGVIEIDNAIKAIRAFDEAVKAK